MCQLKTIVYEGNRAQIMVQLRGSCKSTGVVNNDKRYKLQCKKGKQIYVVCRGPTMAAR